MLALALSQWMHGGTVGAVAVFEENTPSHARLYHTDSRPAGAYAADITHVA
jgi:hypothetical protein